MMTSSDNALNADFKYTLSDLDFIEIVNNIQAQYRETNLNELLSGIVEITEKYVGSCINSLEKDGLNLVTARGDFLDLWATILGITRYLPADESQLEGNYFNFRNKNFLQLQFFSKEGARYKGLDDLFLRPLLLFLAQKMYNPADLVSTNEFLSASFADYGGVLALKDSYDMNFAVLYFKQSLPVWLEYALTNLDILPRPAGVGIKFDIADYRIIGFETNNADYNANELGAFWRSIFKREIPKTYNFFGCETYNKYYNADRLGAFYNTSFADDIEWQKYAQEHPQELADFRNFSFETTNADYNLTKTSGFYLSQFKTNSNSNKE